MGQYLSSDILFSRNYTSFLESVHYNPTFSKVYSNFSSFTFAGYKSSSVFTLLFQTFSLVSNFFIVSWGSQLFKGDIIEKIVPFNYTHRENCLLLNSVQEFIEIEAWLFLTFFLCLQNQLVSISFYCHILTQYRCLKNMIHQIDWNE